MKRYSALITVFLLALLAGCSEWIPDMPAEPNFAPVKQQAAAVIENAKAADNSAAYLLSLFIDHTTDTRPTSSFVTDTIHVVRDTKAATAATVAAATTMPAQISDLEEQSDTVYQNDVDTHEVAKKAQDDLEKEKNSWFGGKLGHLLLDALIALGLGLAAWIISKLLLAGATSGIAGLGLLSDLGTPLHIVANIIESVLAAIWAAIKGVVKAIQWFWDEVILKHVPYPPTATPAAATPVPTTGGK
jgi:hypothetical protein